MAKKTSKKTKKASSRKKAPSKKAASRKKKAPAKKKAASKKKAPAKKAASKKKADSKSNAAGNTTPGGKRRRQTVLEAVMATDADNKGYVFVNGRKIRKITTDPEKMPKKKRSTSSSSAKDAAENKNAKPVKTKLTSANLKEFLALLLAKRRELFSAVDSLENEALRSDDGDTSSMPIHMADVGSDVYEQDLMLGMAASERDRIREIDEALQRIKDKTYGICMLTGKQIKIARLRAKPWAKYSIDAKRQVERGIVS